MATAIDRRVLTPADHGSVMSFEDFVECDCEEGRLYDLARGIIIVTDVPNLPHGMIVWRVSSLFNRYDATRPGLIRYQAGEAECRLRMPEMASDRHPDQAIYLTPQPPIRGREVWTYWIPTIVVEVVSEGSDERDYAWKREEYLRLGVLEYWILDPMRRLLLVVRRAGDRWAEQHVPVGQAYQTHLLPGLVVDPGALLGPPDAEDE